MLAHLIALGVLTVPTQPPADVGSVIAGTQRTVSPLQVPSSAAVGDNVPLGAYRWPAPMEPADRAPYAFDWSKILGTDEKIAEITRVTMSAAGAAVGVEIDSSTGRRPIISENGKAIQLWFLCLDAFQDNPVFGGNGVNITVTCRVRTDASPYKQFERTAVLTVRQQ